VSAGLARVERIIDASGAAGQIEVLLPAGVRPRQLHTHTLLVGMVLTMLDGRDALLSNVHKTLLALPADDRLRLGVIAHWRDGEHTLTYRQLEYTYRLISKTLAKEEPDGTPSELLSDVLDRLLEASIQVLGEPESKSYAVDWTAHEAWSRPPAKPAAHNEPHTQPAAQDRQPPDSGDGDAEPAGTANAETPPQRERRCDQEAAWGHRTVTHPAENEMFFGYYLQGVTAVRDEHGPPVPELIRRMHLASCHHDPPAQIVPVLGRMHNSAIPIDDLLADSGYSYRQAETFALPIRQLGTQLIIDLHPNDRGPHGTHHGAIRANGHLYCPATPPALLQLAPLPPGASAEQTDTHDRQADELAKYKLSPITSYDPDGYRRVICPAAQGKLRCPHRPPSMTLPHDRPTILNPPQPPPACCTQKTITVPPHVNASTPKPPKNTTSPPASTASPATAAPPPNAPSPPSTTAPPTTSPAAGATYSDSPQSPCSPPPR
jgi:hypothetical protein